MTPERVTWLVLDAVGLFGAVTFVALYAARSRTWWRSQMGRSIMMLSVSLAMLLGLVLAQLIWRPHVLVWFVGLGLLDASLWLRVLLLWRVQRVDRQRPATERPGVPAQLPTTRDTPTGRG